MSTQSTLNSINCYRVLCKGCRAILPIHLFLHPIDPSCYRVRLQCTRCIEKSVKHWRAHREDITAARATRERDRGRITCVCGTSISARYQAKHCKSKRHLSVVAVLRQHNALSADVSASITPAATLAAERESQISQQEFDEVIAKAERDLATYEALRERWRSPPRLPDSSARLVTPTAATAPTLHSGAHDR